MPRRAAVPPLTLALVLVVVGSADAARVAAGWAPGGVPSSPAAVLRDSEERGAAASCGENAALLVRVGRPSLLRRWSAAVGDALIANGWSVRDLPEPGSLRTPALRARLAAAVARCPARTVLLAGSGSAIATVRRATRRVRTASGARISAIAQAPTGEWRIAWLRGARRLLRALPSWPTPTLDDALRGLPQERTWIGARDAPVVIETFLDLQCPYCRAYELEVLPRLLARYVHSGEVRMDAELVAFIGVDSLRGARLVVAAGLQQRLWNVSARFFAQQGEENSGYVTDAFLRRVAASAGTDADRAMADRGRTAVRVALRRAQDRFEQFRLTGAPSLLIGPQGGPLRPFTGSYLRPSRIEGDIQRALRAARASG